ncbi:MAG: hypothetical protein ACTSWW_10715 [Promethearchaeota archaeon]
MKLLISLQENPNSTLEQLALASRFSTSLVFKILKRLTETTNFAKPAFNIVAHPNLFALGLEVVDVIVKCKDLSQIQLMQRLSMIHPYTIYRAKCFGETNGIFFQFRIPNRTRHNIDELFIRLKEENRIEDYQILEFGVKNVIYTTVRLESWNLDQLSWNFNWEEWFTKQPLILPRGEISTQNTPGYVKKWLKQRDVAILNELAIDARRKNKVIMKVLREKSEIDFSPQSFSRRFMKIKEECVDLFRVFIDPNAFQLITPVLILGNGDASRISELTTRLKTDPIPFNSVLKTRDTQFFWYLHVPSIHLTYILHELQGILTELQFLFIDVGTVQTWGMWHDTYDDAAHNWIQTRKFMVDDVFSKIQER